MINQHDKKKRFGWLLLAPLALLAPACVAESGEAMNDTGSEAVGEAEEAQIKRNPDVGESCHVEGAGITYGTLTKDGECCGVKTCSDRQTCGKDLGHYIPACAACDWFKCDPGATALGGVVTPVAPGGGVLAP